MRIWSTLNGWPWYVRGPIKLAAFGLVLLLTLYPRFWLLPRHIQRLRDMDSALQPELPGLSVMAHEVWLTSRPDEAVLSTVEDVVYWHIPYAWDWDTWGVVDYLPSTSEVLAMGREDCDGRAVVAASLLRRMGYEAHLVCDLKHVWVSCPQGQLMSPGAGETSLVATESGTQVRFSRGLLANLGRGLTFGIAVFPLGRELIIVAALCAVLIQPRSSVLRRIAGCAAMLLTLVLFRQAGDSVDGLAEHPELVVLGALTWVAACLLLAIRRGDPRTKADEARTGPAPLSPPARGDGSAPLQSDPEPPGRVNRPG